MPFAGNVPVCHPRVMSLAVGGFEGVCTRTGSRMLVTDL